MKIKFKENIFKYLFLFCAIFGILAVAIITIYLFAQGMPALLEIGIFKFLTGTKWLPSRNVFGILPMIVTSVYVTVLAVIMGVIVGLFTAIYLSRYCRGKLYKILKQSINLLAGIPSVVFGFFGMRVIIPWLAYVSNSHGIGLMASSITLAIMILPTIILISLNSLNSVPSSYYEGALALGATHSQAVFKNIVPAAKSGISAAVILGITRAIGETMAVVMVSGNIAQFPSSLFKGVRTLTGNIVLEMGYAEGLHLGALTATGVVLFFFVFMIIIAFNSLNKRKSDKAGKNKLKRKHRIGESFLTEFSPKYIAKKTKMRFLILLSHLAVIVAVGILGFIVGFVFYNGIPHINLDFLFGKYIMGGRVTMLPSLVTTILVIFLTILIAMPLGIGASIYLNEYTNKGSKIVKYIRSAIDTLSGIPSIIYGLFGLLFFVRFLGLNYSIYAGAFTMVLMILPSVIRTTEESLKAVPDSYREGSFALGAGKTRTIFKVVLPSAISGIITSIILSMGRIIGESAPLMRTVGTMNIMPDGFGSPGVTLAVFMFMLSNEGRQVNEAYAVAVVLIFTIAVLNSLATIIEYSFTKSKKTKEKR